LGVFDILHEIRFGHVISAIYYQQLV
jgi:hypothetical protein